MGAFKVGPVYNSPITKQAIRIFMFSLLWDFTLALVLLVSFPRFLVRFRKSDSLKQAILQKLGFNFPEFSKDAKVIWVHAVSVGEVKAVSKLVEKLKFERPDYEIVVSTTTLTGNAEAKRSIKQASHVVFLPIDLSFIIKKVLNKITPALVILVETDFWYQFMKEAKKRGAEIVLVNGKLSEKSQKGYARVPWITKNLFQWIDLYLLQSIDYVDRFLSIGVSSEKIRPIGNLKLDNEPVVLTDVEKELLKKKLNLGEGMRALVFGSTHAGEEALALDISEKLLKRYSNLLVILVPRHPERFNLVAAMIKERRQPFYRFSSDMPAKENAKIILVDTMGLLNSLYQVSDIAIVCGSFIQSVGGHNIIEPLAFQIPVLYGPYMHKQPEFNQLVLSYKAGIQVKSHDLASELELLLDDECKRTFLGSQGLMLVKENRGATDRAANIILNVVS